ncbi:MAG: prolipoprotein diacylglyceryl transferase [Oscillospiraceae bacterium]|nr:prolipoprotein diacylglyceryl transferase [Oscillospiraceae bacterium]
MTLKLCVFLAIGTVLMGMPIRIAAREKEISAWKAFCVTVLLTVTGTAGTFLMYFIENGLFGGLSFYGAVFLVPVVFVGVALLVKVPYGEVMDLCAVGECIMLALMKIHCKISGCCEGRPLFVSQTGEPVRFPSQIVELVAALLLFTLLQYWCLKGERRNELYGWYLLLYGSSRFVLNIMREAWVTKQMLLPFGNIWSIVAVVVGIAWLCLVKKKTTGEKPNE